MDKATWAKCVLMLREVFGSSFNISPNGIEVWRDLLSDLPDDRVVAAVREVCRTKSAFPRPADIIRLATATTRPDADAAWFEACTRVSAIIWGADPGTLARPLPPLSHPAVEAAMRAVGKEAIRMRTTENEPFLRRDFSRAFLDALQREAMGGELPKVDAGHPVAQLPALAPGAVTPVPWGGPKRKPPATEGDAPPAVGSRSELLAALDGMADRLRVPEAKAPQQAPISFEAKAARRRLLDAEGQQGGAP